MSTTTKERPKTDTVEGTEITVDELARRRSKESDASQLPLFDGYRIQKLQLAFGGSLTLGLASEQHRKIREHCKLDAKVKVTIQIGDDVFDVDGYVSARRQKFQTIDQSRQLVETIGVSIDDTATPVD